GKHILLVQIYVDDIIFASTDPKDCDMFSDEMSLKFQMSMMGQMSFFLGLQVSQSPGGIFINQSKFAQEILKLLAGRVKQVVRSLVGEVQNAFIKGRFILDGVLIANETMEFLKKKKAQGLIFKVDFEKANGDMADMARWMGCGIGEFPFTYLGLPIRENMRRINARGPVAEKFKNKLADWKAKTMSFGGRLTLVKSWWRFRKEGGCLWVKVIKSIHGDSGGLGDVRALGGVGMGSGVWIDIVWGGIEIDGMGLEFSSFCLGVLGGKRVVYGIRGRGLMMFGVGNRNRVIKGRISVRVELDRRGIDLESVLCPCCNNVVETCAHSLVTCDLARSVWDKIFDWWKVGALMLSLLKNFFHLTEGLMSPQFYLVYGKRGAPTQAC
nr:retrovirus-related Pol polyprotein from transposon TNT 1-94 [Tanacetum cinerariifolium]